LTRTINVCEYPRIHGDFTGEFYRKGKFIGETDFSIKNAAIPNGNNSS
jgi:hypothetical protein